MLEKAMKQFGIKEEKIDALEVIIKTRDKDLVIKNPVVSKVNMMGQETFQITGKIEEQSAIMEDDIKTVAEQADVSYETAKKTLEKNKGDLAKSILDLKK